MSQLEYIVTFSIFIVMQSFFINGLHYCFKYEVQKFDYSHHIFDKKHLKRIGFLENSLNKELNFQKKLLSFCPNNIYFST
jgi:hypothetical protein